MNTQVNSINQNGCSVCSEMAYQIGHIETFHIVSLCWNTFARNEVVSAFNKTFGTEIK
jgi:hypothetical protein